MNTPSTPPHAAALDVRVARFGLRVGAALSQHSQDLPADVSERLRFAREQALGRARAARAAQAASMAHNGTALNSRTTLSLHAGGPGAPGAWWFKLATFLPLVLLLCGLLLVQRSQQQQLVAATAEVDTELLSDQLPPEAYSDQGFAEFLRNDRHIESAATAL